MKKLLYWLITISFIVFILLPVLWVLGSSLWQTDAWPWVGTQSVWNLLMRSLLTAGLTASGASFLGIIFGFLLARTAIAGQHWLKILLLLPLLISPYIQAVAWKDIFFLLFDASQWIYSTAGVVFVHTIIFAPLCMLIFSSAFSHIQRQVEEAGRMVANAYQVFFKITLPLIKPAVLTAWMLTFIISLSEFSVPAFYGVSLLTTEIFTQFAAFYNHSLAISQSFLLVAVCLLLLLMERRYLKEAPFLSVGKRGSDALLVDLGRGKNIISAFVWMYTFVVVAFPVIILGIQSFSGRRDHLAEASRLLLPAIGSSFQLALITSLILVFISWLWAQGSIRWAFPKPDVWLLITFALPSTVLGISFITAYNQPVLQWLYGSTAMLWIGLVGKLAFLPAKLFQNGLQQLPASMEEAARMAGANAWQRWRYIQLPLLADTAFSAFMLVFILSLGELGYTIMVYPPGTSLMPIKIFTIMANAPAALTSSMVLIAWSVSLLCLIFLYTLKRWLTKGLHVS